MSFASLCTHHVDLERVTIRKDSSGGSVRQVQDWHKVAGARSVPCSVQQMSQKERLLWAQRQILNSHNVLLDMDIGARREDRLYVVEDAIYLVITGIVDMAGRGRFFMITAQEVSP